MKTKKTASKNLEDKKTIYFQIGLILALIVVFYAFQWKLHNRTVHVIEQGTRLHHDVENIEITMRPPPPPPPPPPSQELVTTPNDLPDFDEPIFRADDYPSLLASTLLILPTPPPEPPVDEVIINPEVMPEFPGGIQALYKYFAQHLRYPAQELRLGIQGTVYVGFVVERDGSISNVHITRGVSAGIDEEALRVVRGMPLWKPGKMGNSAVRVGYSVPISFRQQNR
jgi:periplasmic protein TonB